LRYFFGTYSRRFDAESDSFVMFFKVDFLEQRTEFSCVATSSGLTIDPVLRRGAGELRSQSGYLAGERRWC
jgi:hypothetical protein